jgi:hypothetical protein
VLPEKQAKLKNHMGPQRGGIRRELKHGMQAGAANKCLLIQIIV